MNENKTKGRSNKPGTEEKQDRSCISHRKHLFRFYEYMMIAIEKSILTETPLIEDSRIIYVTKHIPFQNSVFFQKKKKKHFTLN